MGIRLRGLRRVAVGVASGIFGALVVMVTMAGPVLAHATLLSTDPADGAVLPEAPDVVRLVFSEPVTVAADGLRVYDQQQRRVDVAPVVVDQQARSEQLIMLDEGLPEGGYVVVWRVVSADSHPVAGVIRFAVGDAAVLDDELVAELLGGSGQGAFTIVGPLVRSVTYGALLLSFGALIAVSFGVPRNVARRWVLRAGLAGMASTFVGIAVQAAAVTGRPAAAFDPSAWMAVVGAPYGQAALLRVVWLFALVILVRWRAPTVVAVFAAAVAMTSFALDGHQRSVEPVWLLTAADAVHVVAAGLWFGGLVMMAVLLARLRGRTDATVAGLARRGMRRFSTTALWSVAALAVTGGLMARFLVGSPRAVNTTYGWVLVAKIAVVVIVVGIAAYNRWRLLPMLETASRADDDSGRPGAGSIQPHSPETAPATPTTAIEALTNTLRVEVGLLAVVIALTGFLVVQPPAVQVADTQGPLAATVQTEEGFLVDVVVDPNRVGLNTIHVYVLTPAGLPSGEVDDLAIELRLDQQGVGPLRIDPFFAGTGHWIANTDLLAIPGPWQMDLILGIDRFTTSTVRLDFDVPSS